VGWCSVILQMFVRSKRVHVRVGKVHTIRQAIDLVDRFIDNKMEYPLEWDDFISWSNPNATVEQLRDQIANLEPLFLSKDIKNRQVALQRLIGLRNESASLVGLDARN
jgi:hypothetical protein